MSTTPATAVATHIPLSAPVFEGNEAAYLQQCIEEGWVATNGRFTRAFEAGFAALHDRPAALATSTGTGALHLALAGLGIGPGDEVIVPDLTFVATANAVRYVGATPVLADAEPERYGLDPAVLPQLVTPRTRAIIVVHLFGLPVLMEPILAFAAKHGLYVVEDATESLGSAEGGRASGTWGDIGCFSFNGNKIITSGGGGMIVARNPERLDHLRVLAFQARELGTTEYMHSEVGFNYGMPNLQAAVGLAQFERLETYVSARQAVARRYAEGLRDVEGLTFSPMPEGVVWNGWLSSVLVDEERYGEDRIALAARARRAGVEMRPFFTPMHQLPPYAQCARTELPVSTHLHSLGLNLPSSASLTPADQDHVLALLRRED
jgi:perosamine synthetase